MLVRKHTLSELQLLIITTAAQYHTGENSNDYERGVISTRNHGLFSLL